MWRYQYDAFARRVSKSLVENGRERRRWEYLWDGDRILAERCIKRPPEGTGPEIIVEKRLYVHDDRCVRCCVTITDDAVRPLVLHVDHLGTPDLCTDDQRAIVWRRSSTGFGAEFDPGDVRQNFGFPGQYWDDESGLFYSRHRYYDPAAARFIQPDPLGLAGGWDLYAYPPNPLMATDPMGLASRYNIPPQPGTQSVYLAQDPNLLQMKSIAPNIHVFSGASQQVAQSVGQTIPTMGLSAGMASGASQLVVDTHGWPGSVQVFNPTTGKHEWIDGRELGRRLSASGFKGDRVVLVVCHAAEQDASGSSVAQDLADELKAQTGRDVEVIAASGEVINLNDGTLVATRVVTQFPSGQKIGRMEGFGGVEFQSFSAGRPPQSAPGTSGTGMWPVAPPAPKPPGVP